MRVIQGTYPVREKLFVLPIKSPATRVLRRFLLSPGRMQLEVSLDRAVVHYGEKFAMYVAISNNSSKTIRKIKCQLIQLSLLPLVGERRTPFFCLETTAGCPIPPGTSIYRVYEILKLLQCLN